MVNLIQLPVAFIILSGIVCATSCDLRKDIQASRSNGVSSESSELGQGNSINAEPKLVPAIEINEKVKQLADTNDGLNALLEFAAKFEGDELKLKQLFDVLINANPDMAIDFSLKFYHGDARPIKCNQAFEKLVARNWPAAVARLESLPVGQCREFAIQSAARKIDTAAKLNDLEHQVDSFLPEEQERLISSLKSSVYERMESLTSSKILEKLTPSARASFVHNWAVAMGAKDFHGYYKARSSIAPTDLKEADLGFYDGLSNSNPEQAGYCINCQ